TGSCWRDVFIQWDGQWYRAIATNGYTYNRASMSSVAFFPLYPLASRAISRASGLPMDLALLLVSHTCFFASLVLFDRYIQLDATCGAVDRSPGQEPDGQAKLHALSLILFPTSFFFLMAYTESMCLLFMLDAMYGIRRRW